MEVGVCEEVKSREGIVGIQIDRRKDEIQTHAGQLRVIETATAKQKWLNPFFVLFYVVCLEIVLKIGNQRISRGLWAT